MTPGCPYVCLSVCLSVDVSVPQPAPGFYSSREQLLLVSNSCRHIPFSDGRVPVSHFSRPNANRCLRVKEGSFSTKNNENKLHKFVDRKYVYYSISAICFGHLGQTSDTTCNSYENLSLKIVRMAETCTRSWIINVFVVHEFVCLTVGTVWWNYKSIQWKRITKIFHAATRAVWIRATANKINPLNTKRRPLYLKTQFVPRSKHFSSRL